LVKITETRQIKSVLAGILKSILAVLSASFQILLPYPRATFPRCPTIRSVVAVFRLLVARSVEHKHAINHPAKV